jgi:two-component system sensor histidine kinase VicK
VNKKNIDLSVDMPEKLKPVYMDEDKIILVLRNLLDNATKYTPENGKVKVTVTEEEGYLTVAVRDDGIGIPQKELGRTFSKFFRAANAQRVETEGSGLGLYIAKNIVNKHKGKMYVDSVEGRGTTFSFSLPYKKAN